MTEKPVLGVIGGSGIYQMSELENVQQFDIETPFGKPSSPITVGELSGKKVAFLARHGIGHFLTPTEVNYRANIYALKSLGVQNVLSISACGSLREDFEPGHFVIPDQLVDFTKDRKRSFFEDGVVVHVGVANPFCPDFSRLVLAAANESGAYVHPTGTFITIEGPRFSTRGESNLFRAWGMDIIGMTTSPEAFLAREAEMCYATLAHITDYDVWHSAESPVSVDMVIQVLSRNTHTAFQVVKHLARVLPRTEECSCSNALADAFITQSKIIPAETRRRLGILVHKYQPE